MAPGDTPAASSGGQDNRWAPFAGAYQMDGPSAGQVRRVPGAGIGSRDVSTATGAACCAVAEWQENDARASALPSAAKLSRDVIAPLRCITLRTFLDGKVVFRKCYHEGRLPNAETCGPAGPPPSFVR